MKVVGIYIQDSETSQYNRVDLFDDEKISITSSIQNINDISKTYTDFSQTFTVPATKQNNKIFRHWYDNSNDIPFSTLVKADAYIEIDTIPFRKGKIQLESANVVDGQTQEYSITFIGTLGNLKDTFAGKYLKDLTLDTSYNFNYTPNEVISRVVNSVPSQNIMFPLISSNRTWNYGSGNAEDISNENYPIRYNELFPALRLRAVLNMIETQFGINFDGTVDEPSTFLTDARFTNAFLYLKNKDNFIFVPSNEVFTFQTSTGFPTIYGTGWQSCDFTNYTFKSGSGSSTTYVRRIKINLYPTQSNITYVVNLFNVSTNELVYTTGNINSIIGLQQFTLFSDVFANYQNTDFQVRISSFSNLTFSSSSYIELSFRISPSVFVYQNLYKTSAQTVNVGNLSIRNYMPEIKIEDFFSGLLKMFNLTCYSNDGINYTVEQLESYYGAGSDIDITKYVLQDKKALNRVKTYKRINFEYEKSESFVNVNFNSVNGIEYGSLYYENNPKTEGEEYSVKLPFENLNFINLFGSLQTGYCLKTDLQKYIPNPVILYDYNPAGTTDAGVFFYTSESLSGTGQPRNLYKAFGQETLISGETYGLNFNQQQSTLTNEIVDNSLYQNYYSNYFNNIYNLKARLVKVSAILPTSVLTSLKLNDSIIIRDAKYLINSYTTDLTTGLVQFELLTDQR